jgi:hypothetical protein
LHRLGTGLARASETRPQPVQISPLITGDSEVKTALNGVPQLRT